MHTTQQSSRTLAVTLSSVALLLLFFCYIGATDAGLTPRARIARRDVGSAVGITLGLLVFFGLCGWCWLSCMHPQWDPCACCTFLCSSRVWSASLYYVSRGRWGHKYARDDDDIDDLEMAQRRRQSMRLGDSDSPEPYAAHPAMRVPSPGPHPIMRGHSPQQPIHGSDGATNPQNTHDRAVLEIVGHQRSESGEAKHERKHHRRARSQDLTRDPLPENGAGRRSVDQQPAQPAHARSRSEAIERWRLNVG